MYSYIIFTYGLYDTVVCVFFIFRDYSIFLQMVTEWMI